MVRQVVLEPTPSIASPNSGQAWGVLNSRRIRYCCTRRGIWSASTDGVILILEAGNNRIQALDLGANAVRHFTKQASPYSLTLGGTDPMQGWQYLDLAVEYTGYLYVLSFNQNTFVYRLDLYHPDQADSSPVATTMNVNAARLTVDFWRNVYTLNYEVLRLPGGAAAGLTEPSVSLWTPCDAVQTC
jgi:hypothetical protein